MMPGGGLDVLFGPFLTLMAPIPGSNDPRSQPHHAGKENVQYHEPSSESEGGHSDDDFAPSTNTNRSATWQEAPTSQAESKLLNRRLGVWNGTLALKHSKLAVPTPMDLMVLDGWGEQGGLVYCSVETKARFTNWTPKICCDDPGTDLAPVDLSEYDTTVYLKVAIFSPAYIRYYFADLLKVAPSNQKGKKDRKDTTTSITSLKIGMKNVNHDPGRPAVRIFTSRGYDLSRPDVIEGANILLAMGDYLESKGPLLKDIEKK
ncbi:hypothetical protein BDDG_00576 [Blastomyces dermatitidis ATCC 18188]|uniref:Uncharacterized protein n=1 Tax=Ajellomyces dermatitidis (strain ATCC 18188 / CBS 674.68) TaxID=653446 RepID=F2T3Y0_AJEDA|nr:hypothetical protein BDDG_00576 [Blastomyces dermatitidis ATCC 18188]